MLQAEVVAS